MAAATAKTEHLLGGESGSSPCVNRKPGGWKAFLLRHSSGKRRKGDGEELEVGGGDSMSTVSPRSVSPRSGGGTPRQLGSFADLTVSAMLKRRDSASNSASSPRPTSGHTSPCIRHSESRGSARRFSFMEMTASALAKRRDSFEFVPSPSTPRREKSPTPPPLSSTGDPVVIHSRQGSIAARRKRPPVSLPLVEDTSSRPIIPPLNLAAALSPQATPSSPLTKPNHKIERSSVVQRAGSAVMLKHEARRTSFDDPRPKSARSASRTSVDLLVAPPLRKTRGVSATPPRCANVEMRPHSARERVPSNHRLQERQVPQSARGVCKGREVFGSPKSARRTVNHPVPRPHTAREPFERKPNRPEARGKPSWAGPPKVVARPSTGAPHITAKELTVQEKGKKIVSTVAKIPKVREKPKTGGSGRDTLVSPRSPRVPKSPRASTASRIAPSSKPTPIRGPKALERERQRKMLEEKIAKEKPAVHAAVSRLAGYIKQAQQSSHRSSKVIEKHKPLNLRAVESRLKGYIDGGDTQSIKSARVRKRKRLAACRGTKEREALAKEIVQATLLGWLRRRQYLKKVKEWRASKLIMDALLRWIYRYRGRKMRERMAIERLKPYFLGWIARRRYRRLVKMDKKRNHVAQEILTTERSYVGCLKDMIEVFLNPLRKSSMTSNPILTTADIRTIFSEVEVIVAYNSKLLDDLEKRMKKWSSHQCLGDIFLQITDYLKVYTQYLNNYNRSLATLDGCSRNKEFAKFLESCKGKHNRRGKGHDLPSLLIMPVQRIPRYNLLLQDLVSSTWNDHPDKQALHKALTKVQLVAHYVNEKKREAENASQIYDIQRRVVGKVELLAPTRRFVREGALMKLKGEPGHHKLKPVYLFLFNDSLLYTRKMAGLVTKKDQFKYRAIFKLVFFRVEVLEDTAEYRNAFVLCCGERRQITFCMESREDMQSWVDEINACIESQVDVANIDWDIGSSDGSPIPSARLASPRLPVSARTRPSTGTPLDPNRLSVS